MSENISYYRITNEMGVERTAICRIGIINEDKSVEMIYCNQNSEPSHQTPILLKYYNTAEKVKELVSLGDIQYLGKRIEPTDPEKHSHGKTEPDVVLALRRDIGCKWGKPVKTLVGLLKTMEDIVIYSHMYLFDSRTNEWLYCEWDGRTWHFMPFTEPFDEEHLPKGEILFKDLETR